MNSTNLFDRIAVGTTVADGVGVVAIRAGEKVIRLAYDHPGYLYLSMTFVANFSSDHNYTFVLWRDGNPTGYTSLQFDVFGTSVAYATLYFPALSGDYYLELDNDDVVPTPMSHAAFDITHCEKVNFTTI